MTQVPTTLFKAPDAVAGPAEPTPITGHPADVPAAASRHFFRRISGGGTQFHTVAEVPKGWRLRVRRISGTLHRVSGPRQLLLGVNGRAAPRAGTAGPNLVERQLLSFSEPDGPEQYVLPLTALDLPVAAGEHVFVSVQGTLNGLTVFVAGEWEPAGEPGPPRAHG